MGYPHVTSSGGSYYNPNMPAYAPRFPHQNFSGYWGGPTHSRSGHALVGGAPNLTVSKRFPYETGYYAPAYGYGTGPVGALLGTLGAVMPDHGTRRAFAAAAIGVGTVETIAAMAQPQPAPYYAPPVQYAPPPAYMGPNYIQAPPPAVSYQAQRAIIPSGYAGQSAALPPNPNRSQAELYAHYRGSNNLPPSEVGGQEGPGGSGRTPYYEAQRAPERPQPVAVPIAPAVLPAHRPTTNFGHAAARPQPVQLDPNANTYTIRPGDQLGYIGLAVNPQGRAMKTAEELAAINGIANPNIIKHGTTIKVAETLSEFMARGDAHRLTSVSSDLHTRLATERAQSPEAFAVRMAEAERAGVRIHNGQMEKRDAQGNYRAVDLGRNGANPLQTLTESLGPTPIAPAAPAAAAAPSAARPQWLAPTSAL